MHRPSTAFSLLLSLLAGLCGCVEPDCPSYLRGEGEDCIVPSKPDSGAGTAEREQPQTMAGDAGTRRPSGEGAGGRDSGAGGTTARDAATPTAGNSGSSDSAATPSSAAGAGGMSMMMPSTAGAPAVACGNGNREGSELCDGADCPTECKSDNVCSTAHLEGSPSTCDAKCVTTEITVCNAGDGCCPMGCDYGKDSDCSPSCGDGERTDMETCEPNSTKYACPTLASCDDKDPCTEDKITGDPTQCSARCTHMPITRAGVSCDDDDPCTDDMMVESTTACSYECMHSAPKRPTESCEDSDPCTDDTPVMNTSRCAYDCPHKRQQPAAANCDDKDPCTEDTSAISRTQCAYECSHTAVPAGTSCADGMVCSTIGKCEAPPERCGDGVVSQNEECDPAAPGQVVGYTCNTSCRRLNRLTKCDGPSQCEGNPASKCDIPGICRPLCSTQGGLCDILPGATTNESACTNGACAYLCTVYQDVDPEHCGPSLWCDGTYCRVKP